MIIIKNLSAMFLYKNSEKLLPSAPIFLKELKKIGLNIKIFFTLDPAWRIIKSGSRRCYLLGYNISEIFIKNNKRKFVDSGSKILLKSFK